MVKGGGGGSDEFATCWGFVTGMPGPSLYVPQKVPPFTSVLRSGPLPLEDSKPKPTLAKDVVLYPFHSILGAVSLLL